MRKILVLRGGALGDFIVTLPALRLLRQRWPDARIELIGNATAARLALHRGWLDGVHSQHDARWSALFAEGPLEPGLSAWLAEFDLVVNYWPDDDQSLRRRFPLRPGQTYLSAAAMPTRAPAAAHYCAPLQALGLTPSENWARLLPLPAPDSPEPNPPRPPRTTLVLHPGSGSPRKNWPAENWRELIALLPPPLTLLLGEAEAATWGAFVRSGVTVLKSPDLEDLVGHLSSCRLFLGHDSGISHLAAACGAPCLLLFGPTDPALWAPPAPHVQVLRRGPTLEAIGLTDVRRAVAAALADQA